MVIVYECVHRGFIRTFYINRTCFIYVRLTNVHHIAFISLFMINPCNAKGWKCNMQVKYKKGPKHYLSLLFILLVAEKRLAICAM